jgi:hypothetical protein
MVANMKVPTLAEAYAGLCAFLKTNPKLTVITANHIAAKHGIHSLPSFHTTDAVSEQDKLVTYGEIIRALAKSDYSTLQGQLANGQAAHVDEPKKEAAPIIAAGSPPSRFDLPPPKPRVIDPLVAKAAAADVALTKLKGFMGREQLATVRQLMKGEEKEFFYDKMIELADVVEKMPSTGQAAKDPIVHLHYFVGACDWYIYEKDKGAPDDKPEDFQSQARGYANLGDPQNAEVGYISLPEMFAAAPVELDFHWKPEPLSKIRAKVEGEPEPRGTFAEDVPVVPPEPAPAVAPTPASSVPWDDAALRRQFDALLEVAGRIPGATITLQISLPTHV